MFLTSRKCLKSLQLQTLRDPHRWARETEEWRQHTHMISRDSKPAKWSIIWDHSQVPSKSTSIQKLFRILSIWYFYLSKTSTEPASLNILKVWLSAQLNFGGSNFIFQSYHLALNLFLRPPVISMVAVSPPEVKFSSVTASGPRQDFEKAST